MGQKFDFQNQIQDFEKMKQEMRSKPKKQQAEDEEDFEDELQDQMAESLFQEADQMGIFQESIAGAVDYSAALKKIESEIAKKND